METYLYELITYALDHCVSDIHFEVVQHTLVIYMRNDDGMFLYSDKGDIHILDFLRFKTNMDMSSSQKLQSGSYEMELHDKRIPIRFSYISTPTLVNGALRIMEPNRLIDVNSLSIDKKQNKLFSSICAKRDGLVLLSGATGSGKTTTLYALMDECKKLHKHIFTIEDPVEIIKNGMVQLQVQEPNMGYDVLIRQILRHDPDVLMLGEIRDANTAQMAVRASLTGHLVFSTIHASSAAGVIARLVELGIPKEELRNVLLLVSNQRLVKGKDGKICIYDILNQTEIERVLDGEYIESRLSEKIEGLFKKNLITKSEFKRASIETV